MYKLLIVDDEPNIRKGLIRHYPWSELGFEVVGDFANAKLALDYMVDHSVHVVLTDIKMPVMDGIELARTVKERNPDVIVIFLSAYADFEFARQAIVYSVKDYILKPVQYENIVMVFKKLKKKLDAQTNRTAADESRDKYYDKLIKTVEEYVLENLKEASLENAAQKVNLSPNYLSKIFKEKKGMNFSDFLFETRMKKSKELMSDLNLKIYHISSAIGYNNPKNFSRAFKQYHGVSPSEFR